jgi:hypothetical protein
MRLATKRKLLIIPQFEVQLQVFCLSVAGHMFYLWIFILVNRIRQQSPILGGMRFLNQRNVLQPSLARVNISWQTGTSGDLLAMAILHQFRNVSNANIC